MASATLGEVCQSHGRGGAHRRSRGDEAALVAAVAERIERPAGAAASLRELWLLHGFRIEDRRKLGNEREQVFGLEDGVSDLRAQKLQPLRNKRPDGRLRAAEWWLKTANAKPSRRNESLLCSPTITDTLADRLGAERDIRVREALAGALALVVAKHFPDESCRPLFVRMLGDRHAGVRFFAVQGVAAYLGRGHADGDLAAIVERAADGASGVRQAVVTALLSACDEGRLTAGELRGVWPQLEPLSADSADATKAAVSQLADRIGLGSADDAR